MKNWYFSKVLCLQDLGKWGIDRYNDQKATALGSWIDKADGQIVTFTTDTRDTGFTPGGFLVSRSWCYQS